MEALPADPCFFPFGLDKRNGFFCGGEADCGHPSGRAPAENNDHTKKVILEDFDALVHRLREEFAGERIDLDDLLAPDLPDRDIDLFCIDLDVLAVRF